MEKEKDLFIKCLRTDRGGEFTSSEFNEFCERNGVKRQLTAAYTPQQNGVAERKNQIVMNMVRYMLSNKKVPKNFWAEAVMWTFHVLNRCPTSALEGVTPQEAWSGIKPSVEHFRIFGCIAHAHVPSAKRGKLDNRSIVCILLGVSKETKGYRLYDPLAKRIIVSRDVVFEEEKEWNWDSNQQGEIAVNLDWGENEEYKESEGVDRVNEELCGDGTADSSSERGVTCVIDDVVRVSAEGVSEAMDTNRQDDNIEGENGVTDGRVNRNTDALSVFESHGRRPTQQPVWMNDYVDEDGLDEDEVYMAQAVAVEDPFYFAEAVKDAKWRQAMDNEMAAIEKNRTWTLTELPVEAKKIGVKWLFKTKYNECGRIDKHKARLVAKGYT